MPIDPGAGREDAHLGHLTALQSAREGAEGENLLLIDDPLGIHMQYFTGEQLLHLHNDAHPAAHNQHSCGQPLPDGGRVEFGVLLQEREPEETEK